MRLVSSIKIGAIAASVLAIGACSSHRQVERNPQYSSISEPLAFEQTRADELNLVTLIDPERRRVHLASNTCENAEAGMQARGRENRHQAMLQQLECAIQAFKTYHVSYEVFRANPDRGVADYDLAANSLALAIRRNEIQDRMLLRSDNLCRDFERRLDVDLRIENDTNLRNYLRNSQSGIFREVSNLLPAGDVVWAITSGTGITDVPTYVHDEGQIEKATVRVSMEGMRLQRRAMYGQIDQRRRAPVRHGGLPIGSQTTGEGVTTVSGYSLERAISDALAYHHACSMATGMNYAVQVLSNSTPGVGLIEFPTLLPTSVNN